MIEGRFEGLGTGFRLMHMFRSIDNYYGRANNSPHITLESTQSGGREMHSERTKMCRTRERCKSWFKKGWRSFKWWRWALAAVAKRFGEMEAHPGKTEIGLKDTMEWMAFVRPTRDGTAGWPFKTETDCCQSILSTGSIGGGRWEDGMHGLPMDFISHA